MNNPFEEIFKRLENIKKMIAPVTGVQPEERQDGKEPVLCCVQKTCNRSFR